MCMIFQSAAERREAANGRLPRDWLRQGRGPHPFFQGRCGTRASWRRLENAGVGHSQSGLPGEDPRQQICYLVAGYRAGGGASNISKSAKIVVCSNCF